MSLQRHSGNSVLVPSMHHISKSGNIFNAAMVRHNAFVQMLYRAQRRDRVLPARTIKLFQWERMGIVLSDEDNKNSIIFPEKIEDR